MNRNYKQDIEVDFYKLHENWRDQGRLYMDWSEEWANKEEEVKRRKRYLDVDIRDHPSKYGLKSLPSEASIIAKIETDEEYIRLSKEEAILKSVKQAFEHRRQSLEGLTKLFIAGYFTVPNLPLEIKQALKKQIKEEERELRKGITSKRLKRLKSKE